MSRRRSKLEISWRAGSRCSVVENVGGEESAVELRIDEILAENRSRNASAENGGVDLVLPSSLGQGCDWHYHSSDNGRTFILYTTFLLRNIFSCGRPLYLYGVFKQCIT